VSPSPAQQLDRMITGYWISQAIYAAARFGIADLLKEGPRTAADLAETTSTDAGALYRLLRALASVGVFAEDSSGRFALTPLAEPLRSDVGQSKRALALMSGDEQFLTWADIEYSIRTGKTAFEKVFGQPIFEYLGEHSDKAAIFDEAMTAIHGRETRDVLAAYDFSDTRVLADIGGGNGSNIIQILTDYPALQGILFDLPHVVERTRDRIASAGVSDRCQLIAGDFFRSVPAGADTYFLRHIVHDWDDEEALTILRHCYTAMPSDGRLLVVESVIPPGNEPFTGKLLDLVMLLIPGGKERTEPEYRSLLARAGFELSRIIPTATELSIIEAVKR